MSLESHRPLLDKIERKLKEADRCQVQNVRLTKEELHQMLDIVYKLSGEVIIEREKARSDIWALQRAMRLALEKN